MNTKPDETLLALWLEDELQGEELAEVEAWAGRQPEQLAAREEVRRWKTMIGGALPAAEEPPYPDFFNSRIERSIRELASPQEAPAAEPVRAGGSFWRSWFMPASAFAGMALAFWVGTKATPPSGQSARAQAGEGSFAPLVYAPEAGVDAQWFASPRAAATVIVLNGVNAIPDATDFSQTVMVPMPREADSTAGQPGVSGMEQAR